MSEQTPPPEVRCVRVSVRFGDEVVLDELDWAVPSGRITTLLGASGSGKTTLVKVIVGLREPDEGTVLIGDHDVWSCSAEQLRSVRKNLSALLGGSTLYQGLVCASASVRENLLAVLFEAHVNALAEEGKRQPVPLANPYLGLGSPHRSRRVARVDPVIKERAQECLERFDLTHVADLLPADLAAGARRRAALACALAVDVPLYILDDLDGALDILNRARIVAALIETHRRTGATMLIVTHDLVLAEALSDRVAVLCNGRIVAEGETCPVLDRVRDWYLLDKQFRNAAASPELTVGPLVDEHALLGILGQRAHRTAQQTPASRGTSATVR